MDFEERINRITERHEALAQTVELIGHEIRDLIVATRTNTENIAKLVEVTNRDAVDIQALARIVESHERLN